jgi:hypothetical protein
VAGHALTPATRHRLGGPLPHQQADRPRADPRQPELCSTRHAVHRDRRALATVSRCYSRVRGTLPTCYSPVRRFPQKGLPLSASSLDLHVLSTPPAFVLSQDQTLRRDLNQGRTLGIQRSKDVMPDLFIRPSKASPTPAQRFWVQAESLRRMPVGVLFDEGPLISDHPARQGSRQAHCSVLKERDLTPDNKNAGQRAPAGH